MKTVVVGMSGGVDSSLSAALLKEAGYRVIALFMKNWEEEDGPCPAESDFQDVVSVCTHLDIPYYTINFSQAYWDSVFAVCLREFEAGRTPNPDILCNREIKFKLFYEQALKLGADYVATGHYCQIGRNGEGPTLLRGADPGKDQSYFLYTLQENLLHRVLFPVGHLQKSEVRALAEKKGLITAAKKDSTGICFIGKRDFRDFLSRYITKKPGHFETLSHEVVGHHEGASFYTIGQRKGLGIGGAGNAWFVVGKDMERNVVYVVQGEDHPALYTSHCRATDPSWIQSPPSFPLRCHAKIRYRSPDVLCTVTLEDKRTLHVTFDKPQKAVTPAQSIVFYQGEACLGGAIIHTTSEVVKA